MPSLAIALLLGAATPQYGFSYEREGAARCPDAPALRSEVAAHLGFDPFGGAVDGLIAVRIEGAGDALRASLTLLGPGGAPAGKRTLSSRTSDCAELTQALVLAIAMAVDARRAEAAPAQLQASPPRVVVPAPDPLDDDSLPIVRAPPPEALRSLRPVAPEGPPPHLGLGALAAGSMGTAPSLSVGFGAMAELAWPDFSVGIGGRADFPGSALFEGGLVSVALYTGDVSVCFRRSWLGVCALGAAGEAQSWGFGYLFPVSANTLFLAVGARAFVDLPLYGSVFTRIQGDVLAPIVRTAVLVGSDQAWETSAVAGDLAVGLGIRLL